MAWYESKKLWSSLTILLVIVGTFTAVFLGNTEDLVDVLPFLGTVVGGGVAGYAVGKRGPSKKGAKK